MLIILIGCAVFVINDRTKQSSFSGKVTSIEFGDTSLINKITIVHPNAETVNLSKDEYGQWKIDNSFKARKQLINFLLYGLEKLEVKRPVSENQHREILQKLKTKGHKVTIDNEKESVSFSILTNEADVNSSWFATEDGVPVIVHVPGVQGDLSQLVGLGRQDWRTRELFTSTALSLKSIKIDYPQSPSEGFEIISSNNSFLLKGRQDTDTSKTNKYVMAFRYINFDKYLDSEKIKAVSSSNLEPYAIISLTDIDEMRNKVLEIYLPASDGKLYGKMIPGNEWVSLNPKIFRLVLAKKSYFEKSTKQ